MGDLAGAVDEDAVVGAHAGVDHADVGGDEADLGEGGGVGEGGGGFLFRGEDNAVCGWEGRVSCGCEEEEGVELVGWLPLMPRAVTP